MARPPKIIVNDAILRSVEEMAGLGLNITQIGNCLDLSREAFHNYRTDYPEIQDALERGKDKAAKDVGIALFAKACRGDMEAIKWYEKTRLGISDKVEVEHSIKNFVVALPTESESVDEWKRSVDEVPIMIEHDEETNEDTTEDEYLVQDDEDQLGMG